MRLLKTLAVVTAVLAPSFTGTASAGSTADLSVSVVGSPDPVGDNQVITWTITVRNLGPEQAAGVVLRVTYGSDAQLLSATTTQGTCSFTGELDFSLGSMAAGGEVIATVDMITFRDNEDVLGVEVSANTQDPNRSNNEARGMVRVVEGSESIREVGTFCPPVGGVATGGGGTAGSQPPLATWGLLAMAGLVAVAVLRVRR